jgi:hypothetical protein
MTVPHLARLAARALSEVDVAPPPPDEADRARAIAVIEGALRAKRRRAQLRRGAYAAVAVAAAIAAVGVGVRSLRTAPVVAQGSSGSQAVPASLAAGGVAPIEAETARTEERVGAGVDVDVDGERLAPGSRIVARPKSHAILAFSTGARLTLEDGGEVTLVEGGASSVVTLALARGAMHADVPALGAAEALVVRTSDAEVEVRGTSFRVTADGAPCGGASTRIDVYDGSLTVRHAGQATRVDARTSWPRGCASAPSRAPAAGAHASGAIGARAAASPSSLAEQNDLFASAVAAKQAGDAPVALERFEAFTARYPSSPLAESAAAHRMKLLRAVDPGRAAMAARAYLSRWPDGFARAEAEGILSGAR